MTKRELILVVVGGVLLAGVAIGVGVAADRLILERVASGPPQRLAAAMGGLFGGGLVFFAGMIAWFVRRRTD